MLKQLPNTEHNTKAKSSSDLVQKSLSRWMLHQLQFLHKKTKKKNNGYNKRNQTMEICFISEVIYSYIEWQVKKGPM